MAKKRPAPTARTRHKFPEAGGAPEPQDERRAKRPMTRGPATRGPARPAQQATPGSAPATPRRAGPRPLPPAPLTETMRIAKAMARAGLCSRRDAERWIAEGRVRLNGKVLTSPAQDVGPRDRIEVDDQPLPGAEPARLWRYHKPKGCVTTHRDPEGRPTVFEKLPSELPRVISIGRLDFNTEGLLLLTNDGELARHLELPATGWMRRYRVRAFGHVTQPQLDQLKDGLEVDGVRYGPIEATLDQVQGSNVWLTIGLREGKNREVRNILTSLDLTVNRLIRISFGPFQLFDLEEGLVESVKRRVLADQLGPEVADRFGLRAEVEAPPPRKSRQAGPRRDRPQQERPQQERPRK